MNIYESIYKNAVTGSVVITDAKNQMGRLEVQGLERIAFKLFSPGTNHADDQVDASVETGGPFHVYKITDRKQVNQGLLLYTLHFASREFMRNIRTKVSQAYKGRPDTMVQQILKDPEYLDTRKKLKYELIGRGAIWSDAGKIEDLSNITNYVRSVEKVQGIKIACLEEISLLKNWINKKKIKENIKFYGNCEYSSYLKKIII